MALINRMSRLLTADIHAVLDRIEEPEALLRQAIREMEEQIAGAEEHALRLEREHERVDARRQRLAASAAELDAQLDAALDANSDALARKLVRRKLEAGRFGAHLAERLEALDKEIGRLRETLAEQRERLDVLRQKAEVLCERSETVDAHDLGRSEFAVGDDEVEVVLARERERRKRS
ncbi:MAG TPA: PspA/IM30 family protein [Gammaproteobacteria bacterium]|nr:PspA/IM30 family protein [Gammaproteobacteria bacterium]